jgi:hypothetical protein
MNILSQSKNPFREVTLAPGIVSILPLKNLVRYTSVRTTLPNFILSRTTVPYLILSNVISGRFYNVRYYDGLNLRVLSNNVISGTPRSSDFRRHFSNTLSQAQMCLLFSPLVRLFFYLFVFYKLIMEILLYLS